MHGQTTLKFLCRIGKKSLPNREQIYEPQPAISYSCVGPLTCQNTKTVSKMADSVILVIPKLNVSEKQIFVYFGVRDKGTLNSKASRPSQGM